MSLLELLPSHVTPGALAQSGHILNSCPVMSLLELFPYRVTPGAPAGESLSSSGVMLSASHVTWNSCPEMSLLVLWPSFATP